MRTALLTALTLSLAAIPALASEPGNLLFGDNPLHTNPITTERCGSPNVKVTLCLAHSKSGNAYLGVFTHEPRERVGFIALSTSQTIQQADGSWLEEFDGVAPVESPTNGGYYEQTFHFSIRTSRSGQNAKASLDVNGQDYYKNFAFEPLDRVAGP
jgi:hypothetical protein